MDSGELVDAAVAFEAGEAGVDTGASDEADAMDASNATPPSNGTDATADGFGSRPDDDAAVDSVASSDVNDQSDTGAVCSSGLVGGINVVASSDFESRTNSAAGWTGFGGCTFRVASTVAHCGTHSGVCTNRVSAFQGPAYDLPTAAAVYVVSAWALQNGATDAVLLLNAKLVCAVPGGGMTLDYPAITGIATASPNTWTLLVGALTVPSGCSTVQLYLNQLINSGAPSPLPDLYIDDVYANR